MADFTEQVAGLERNRWPISPKYAGMVALVNCFDNSTVVLASLGAKKGSMEQVSVDAPERYGHIIMVLLLDKRVFVSGYILYRLGSRYALLGGHSFYSYAFGYSEEVGTRKVGQSCRTGC